MENFVCCLLVPSAKRIEALVCCLDFRLKGLPEDWNDV